jgi:hypothetical protein
MARAIKKEKLDSINEEIARLQIEHDKLFKLYNEQEQKARTKRLCSRGGYLESRLPETITLTDNQYKVLLETTLFSDKGRSILDWVKDKNIINIEINPETQKRQVTLDNGETHDFGINRRRQESTLRSNGALIYHTREV